MKRSWHALWISGLLAGNTHAIPLMSVTTSTPVLHPPQNLFIDVNISGLQSGGTNTQLGAFQFDLSYDPTMLVPQTTPAGWGSALGDTSAGEAIGYYDASIPGLIHVDELSLLETSAATCIVCTGPYLEDLQGDSFRLITLGFYVLPTADGTSLQFTNIAGSDGYGIRQTNLNATITFNLPVPLPGSLPLLVGGVLGMLAARRSGSTRGR